MAADAGDPPLAQATRLFDRMADGVYVVDADQHIVYWNDAAETLTGVPRERVLGERCYEVVAGTDYDGRCICRRDCATITCTRQDQSTPNYDVLTRLSGRPLWVNVSIAPLRAAGFDYPLAVHIFRDVTHRRMPEVRASELLAGAGDGASGGAAIEASDGCERVQDALTPRELEVLRLIAGGATVRTIACELAVTRATVRAHIEHLMGKLGAHTRLQAVVLAARRGLLEPGPAAHIPD